MFHFYIPSKRFQGVWKWNIGLKWVNYTFFVVFNLTLFDKVSGCYNDF